MEREFSQLNPDTGSVRARTGGNVTQGIKGHVCKLLGHLDHQFLDIMNDTMELPERFSDEKQAYPAHVGNRECRNGDCNGQPH